MLSKVKRKYSSICTQAGLIVGPSEAKIGGPSEVKIEDRLESKSNDKSLMASGRKCQWLVYNVKRKRLVYGAL